MRLPVTAAPPAAEKFAVKLFPGNNTPLTAEIVTDPLLDPGLKVRVTLSNSRRFARITFASVIDVPVAGLSASSCVITASRSGVTSEGLKVVELLPPEVRVTVGTGALVEDEYLAAGCLLEESEVEVVAVETVVLAA